jgi:IclR family acetate operon transcriptional repressor
MVASQGTVRVSEVSRALGVVPSTASRLLAMLQYHELVVHDAGSRAYHAGPALMRVGLSVMERMTLRGLALPFVERLSQELNETVHLVVLSEASVLFIEGVESQRAVRTSRRRGELRPAHCTSGGKAMLATLSREDLLQRYPRQQLTASTPKSITSRDALERELSEVRARGYATSIRESEPDIAAIGAAIVSANDALVAAISVAIPTTRYQRSTFRALAKPLLQTVAEASEKLAFAELLELSHER